MTADAPPTLHASCVAVGDVGLLIRGPSGSGKSTLALIARPPPLLAGLIELRGIGVRRMAHRSHVAVRHVVDLRASEMVRMPDTAELRDIIQGIEISKIPIFDLALAPLVIACILRTQAYEN